jgi:hypothetical protein
LIAARRIGVYQFHNAVLTTVGFACFTIVSLSIAEVFLLTKHAIKSQLLIISERSLHHLMFLGANEEGGLLFYLLISLSHQ